MARSRRYKVPFRRRREGKTDYNLRRKLVLSGKRRVVVRRSNTQTTIQLVSSQPQGDVTHMTVTTNNLVAFGWKGGTGNIPASYLTGYFFAKKVLAQKDLLEDDEELILDIGLSTKFYGGRTFAVLRGAVDGGLDIAHGSDKIFPSEERIRGEHIAGHAKVLAEQSKEEETGEGEKKANIYSKYKIKPEDLPSHFDELKGKIDSAKKL